MADIAVIPTGGTVPIELEDLAATVVALQASVTTLQSVAIVPAVAVNYLVVDSENNRVLLGVVKVDGKIGSVSVSIDEDAPSLVITNVGDGSVAGIITPLPSVGDHTMTITAVLSGASVTTPFTV